MQKRNLRNMSDKKEASHSDKIKRPLVKILWPVKKAHEQGN